MMKRCVWLLTALLLCLGLFACGKREEIPPAALTVLQDLGAEAPELLRDGAVSDNLVKDPAMTVTWDGGYALLDDAGNLVRIKRTEEIRKLSADSVSKFVSLEELITYIEAHLVGPGYELVNSYDFSEDTLSLRYEKVLFPGALDRYDYVSVNIHKPKAELETFYRATSGFQPDSGKEVITQEEAIAVANSLLEENEKITDVQLASVKANDFFGSTDGEGNLHLAYIISTESSMVYVDAYTAQVIGGDLYK